MNHSEELINHISKEHDKKQCIVAFLDIIGFRELIKRYLNPKNPQDKEILKNLQAAMEMIMRHIKYGENEYLKLLKYSNFSDCLCLSIPEYQYAENEATTICLILTTVKNYTIQLLVKGIFVRGGVSVGFHHQDDDMIFSDALIKAYDLESKKAIYPRIILDEEVVKRLKRLWKDQRKPLLDFSMDKLIIFDENGTVFVNPFNGAQSLMKKGIKLTKKEKRRIDLINNKNIRKNVEKTIREKQRLLKVIKGSFDNKKEFEDYLSNPECILNNKISEKDKEKLKNYIKNKRILDKNLWLKELINWNSNPKRSNIKFEYLLK